MKKKQFTIIRPATHDEWLNERTKGIGSSEAGTICCCNPFDTPLQLWRRKKGIDQPVPENESMLAGHFLEQAVADYYTYHTGHTVIKASSGDWLAVDNDKPYLRVSPDRLYWLSDSRSPSDKGVLECKTTTLEVDPDHLPPHWFIQLQYQLGVMRLRHGVLAWLTQGKRFGWVDVDFDHEFYKYIVQQVEAFWTENIQGDKEPDVYNVDDAKLKWPRSSDRQLEASSDIMEQVILLKDIKPRLAELEAQKKDAEKAIRLYLEDADVLTSGGDIIATYRSNKDSSKFNEKKFMADHPELHQQYCETTPGARPLKLK